MISISDVIQHFCVAFSDTSSPKKLRRYLSQSGKEPALPAAAIRREAKSRAVVTRKACKRREQLPYPQARLEVRVFAAQIDNQRLLPAAAMA